MSSSTAQIDRNPEVVSIAKTLGISGSNLKSKICRAAVVKVCRRMELLNIQPESLNDVHALVLNMTRVRIQRLNTDQDLERLAADFKQKGPVIPVQLEFEFARNTEALVFRDDRADPRSASYTAVVDARGPRRNRAWFAERHEPAHLLIPDSSGLLAWRRTTVERPEPVEQVIDEIASHIGFWEPIVRPILKAAFDRGDSVLDAFDYTRQLVAPDASREAAYRAFARLAPFPLCVVRADVACRKDDPANENGTRALRATTVLWNDAADAAGIRVWQNFRIPPCSVIQDARADFSRSRRIQDDDLSAWRTEGGQPLARKSCPVRITAIGAWATIEVAG